MAADDAATQPIQAQLLALGTEWRSRHVPTERLAMHISALAKHEQTLLPRHTYPLQQAEFVLTDTPPLPHRRLRPPQRYIISAVAAVMVIALLGAAFLVVTRRATGTHLPAATVTLPSATTAFINATDLPFTATAAVPVDAQPLRSLHMIDATTGWAQTDQKILRTTDGSVHWHDVTPPGIVFPIPMPRTLIYSALDAATAWVSDGKAIYHTTNAGQTWQMMMPPVENYINYLTFVDGSHGWAVDYIYAGASSEHFNLLRTTNGGASWVQVTTAGGVGGLPAIDSSNPAFINTTTGWIGGPSLIDNNISFYVTRDGGVTWHKQALPHPMTQNFQMSITTPTFLNTQDGAMATSAEATGGSTVMQFIYVTHDGGSTWSIAGTAGPDNSSEPYFLDMSHWWDIGGPNSNDLAYTADGGQHWTPMTPGEAFSNIRQLDFVTTSIGWAVGYNTATLLQTSDGGHTWQQIAYHVG